MMVASAAVARFVYRTLLVCSILAAPALAAAPPPSDALSPEGRSRWDLSALPAAAGRAADLPPAALAVLRPGESRAIELDGSRLQLAGRGVGWAELPEGPREATLLRVALERRDAADGGWRPARHGWAWVDGDARLLASVLWDGVPDDWSAPPEAAAYGPDGVADLKIYSTEIATGPFHDVSYGWDRGKGTPVSALTTPSYATAGELIAASSWDFSVNTSGTEVAESQAEITAAETCNLNRCGYTAAAGWSLAANRQELRQHGQPPEGQPVGPVRHLRPDETNPLAARRAPERGEDRRFRQRRDRLLLHHRRERDADPGAALPVRPPGREGLLLRTR